MSNRFYLTTTLPYVNADPHIGFALEIVQADCLARWHRRMGDDVVFNTGTDEHGQKIWKKAQEANMEPKAYCDGYAERFHGLKDALHLTYTHFIRTTDEPHVAAAQEFWRRCKEKGDIYKKEYKVKYCVGCELEKTDSDLVDGTCPIHPNREIELIEEENYFFRFSHYQEPLLKLYQESSDFVIPDQRFNEIKTFVKGGLHDFSVSRLAVKMPWGIPVPDDPEHVMYVWFDALVNYISTLGWPKENSSYKDFWPGVQVAGKDNLRQQSAMWQAMLLSAGLPPSRQIFIHGFITANGQKMSKSVGNVVHPYDLVSKHGTDAVRAYLLGGIPSYEDGDFTEEAFEAFYVSRLANGIGNVTARVLAMIQKYCDGKAPEKSEDPFDTAAFWKKEDAALSAYRFDEAMKVIDALAGSFDRRIEETKPWEMAKEGRDVKPLLYQLAEGIRHLALACLPMIPSSAEKMLVSLGIDPSGLGPYESVRVWGGWEPGTAVRKGEPLFPRKEKTEAVGK
ncbi:MAG TPA: methionine--tRNA ligase [Patescibacteria group bacterium]|nr:methionine--tRNA ligase [Patescibacteria group bacterium]